MASCCCQNECCTDKASHICCQPGDILEGCAGCCSQVLLLLQHCTIAIVRDGLPPGKTIWWKKGPLLIQCARGALPPYGDSSFYMFAEHAAAKEQWFLALQWGTGTGKQQQQMHELYRAFCGQAAAAAVTRRLPSSVSDRRLLGPGANVDWWECRFMSSVSTICCYVATCLLTPPYPAALAAVPAKAVFAVGGEAPSMHGSRYRPLSRLCCRCRSLAAFTAQSVQGCACWQWQCWVVSCPF